MLKLNDKVKVKESSPYYAGKIGFFRTCDNNVAVCSEYITEGSFAFSKGDALFCVQLNDLELVEEPSPEEIAKKEYILHEDRDSLLLVLEHNNNCTDCNYCKNSYHCTGCSGCNMCERCNACDGCKECTCCSNCSGCSKCVTCIDCVNCVDCSNCVECILCTGLENKRFMILDIQFQEAEYWEVKNRVGYGRRYNEK